MAREVRIYCEGDPRLHRQLASFLRRGLQTDTVPRLTVIGCKSRSRTLKTFALALGEHRDAFNILLVDAEAQVTVSSAWDHLRSLASTRLTKPQAASEDQAHLMVQIMESWFLADRQALQAYYGQGYNTKCLPKRQDIEAVPKDDVLAGLHRAAGRRGYSKTVHAPDLLQRIDPGKVRAASPWCERLFATISGVINAA